MGGGPPKYKAAFINCLAMLLLLSFTLHKMTLKVKPNEGHKKIQFLLIG
jgi:hypothetical protein